MGNKLIIKNVTITGYNKGGKNRIIIVQLPANVTLSNNKFIDASWENEVFGIALGNG
jgi:hypothetical protein